MAVTERQTTNLSNGRRLGALEELFWLYDQASPVHFAIAAEVVGSTDLPAWRRALDHLQRRHSVMGFGVDPNTRSFVSVANAPIPLHVVTDATAVWSEEVRRELATPFAADAAPLIRAVLLQHRPDRATLILIVHHAIADGLSLTFAIRDLLEIMAGAVLPMFRAPETQEHSFGFPALETASAITCEQTRSTLDRFPEIEYLRLNPAETTALIETCREHGATVQSALCAAVAIAGQALSAAWPDNAKLVSPVSTRARTDAAEQCALSIIPTTVPVANRDADNFWGFAGTIKEGLRRGQTEESVSATLGGIHQLMSANLGVAAMADVMETNFLTQGMVSNLGVMPFGADFGPLRLAALWGPATTVVGRRSQTIGAVTFNGSLYLTHTSHELTAGLLEKTKEILMRHCADRLID